MHINQDNYEEYFLDHTEGNLSPEMEGELSDFLEANPDLKPVLESFDPSPLQKVKIPNEKLKTRLKKSVDHTEHINEDDVEDWLIREVEGLLNEIEAIELREFLLLNPAYKFDQKLFGLSKLTPDLSISFPRKNELRKKAALVPLPSIVWSLSAAAAVILLFIGIRFFQEPEVNTSVPVITHEIISTTETPESNHSDIKKIETLSAEIPSAGTPSHKTPPPIPRPGPIRMKLSVAKAVIKPNPVETLAGRMTAYDIPPIETQKKEKPFIAKVFSNLAAKAREGINNRPNLDNVGKPDFSFWSIARAGIEGYNSLSDRDLELYVRKDEAGKVKSYALVDQDRLLWSKNLDR